MAGALTIHDNNTTVAAKVGQPLHITLKGNPTTGYRWTRVNYEEKDVLSDDDMEVVAEFKQTPSKPGMVGVGGEYHVTVTPKRPGKHTVELVYARSFEGTKPDSQKYVLHLDTK
ncbi:inhibitor of cysteine peptidase (ICP) [Leptomonas pyrrhocoris]|uniref:Inhibitor of cysteine peptidase (ICP) n=1 Tax=Leptomonas pyrrhocoris TaxID=157538 RepID=A0A0N0DUQ3_LEPPY|nr:inhibitor of cysteine peptidase (ICP) [Leptomonas pyrrhocoris]XP_015657706.1 inhibitor of cysteine peptidase (ICP) [Leptomonas pyrrhocoris]XP_015657707.1 inhibitor of cysteine peptidase (ICP) [Leptomonas pyrrhocoris]XP_015657708.1 inhibitor of cysteine peptidase (ICP) [Leptomonas pyrrhocoris]XP_015657709.1 inhibitor of cysteine peptidase (ICP) [Leptomonas pyrrhocoris]KPA79266.1 inhibitor of cysteine peptidase (ICP) [Leptomonas pyrrhocoris]KPA79267.1 inhibitor of cysteine peptidase (ICP) [L|eukprot:XP_015657705.1 inhibitor of cysteine peptidase (ICP) [Leptomonas pyrrhocoris]